MTGLDITKPRILITDDEPEIRSLLAELLSENYDCEEANSGEEALERLEEHKFDLLLTDIMMGGISGLELVPRVLEISPDTVVIMISGEKTIESAISALRVGAFDYITKPFDLNHVEAAVKRALDHRALRQAKRFYENFLEELVKQRTAELGRTNQTLSTLVQASPVAIMMLDNELKIKAWNPAAERIFGEREEDVLGRPFADVAGNGDREGFTWLEETLNDKPSSQLETRLVNRDGRPVDVNIWTATLREIDGELAGVMAVIADVTERKQAEERIQYLAYHDTLTDLPNRVLFEDRLNQSLTQAMWNNQKLAVMFLSIDRFKKFNDTLGHAIGDMLLREIAVRLVRCVGGGNTVARFASDEFSLLINQINSAEDAAEIARAVANVLEEPFALSDQELYVTASIGIGLYPYDGRESQPLLQNAGAALYRAKQQGGNNYQFYTADMNARALKRLSVESKLRRALDGEEFRLYYQPQISLSTGQITAMEALVRWQQGDLELLQPAEFIPVAEDTGLIVSIGEWVLRSACRQTKAWIDSGFGPLRVAVNLSPRQFQQRNLLELIDGVLAETGLDPELLELEITESSIMQNAESAIETLSELKTRGVKISIDDFGSGYSSLSYLKRFPIDVLKIDQSFVRDTTTDPKDAAIVMAIITLAHSLNLKVIAEGVETEEQLRFLRLLRCDNMQGYLFSKPLPVDEFEQLLFERRKLSFEKVPSPTPA